MASADEKVPPIEVEQTLENKENEAPAQEIIQNEEEIELLPQLQTPPPNAEPPKVDAPVLKPELDTTQPEVAEMVAPPVKPQFPAKDNNIPKELLVKHPLQYQWVLYYCKADRTKNWEDCLKQVAAFDTVEDFWALYNHIQLASGLSLGSDYYLFKQGIRPMWEDEHNVNGGRWLIMVDKGRRNDLLDHYWLELLMAMIGEQFEDFGEQICGAVVNCRGKGDKVSLWTRDADKPEACLRIGTILKTKLGIQERIRYEVHSEVSHKTSSTVKEKLAV